MKLRPGRIMALDFGRVHTGVAVSDPDGIIVRPLDTIESAATPDGLEKIASVVAAEEVSAVVVGMPISLSGEPGAQAAETAAFVTELEKALSLPVSTWDERFTSKLAAGKARHSGANMHSLAACCLLEDYLGSEAYRRRRPRA